MELKTLILIGMIVLLSVMIAGCSSQPKEVIITKYEYVTMELPKGLTQSCIATKPIDINTYTNYSEDAKNKYLTNYVITLLGDVKKCDNKVSGLVKYVGDYNNSIKERK